MRSARRFVAIALLCSGLVGCVGADESPRRETRPSVFVTIEPLRYFADQIGGGLVDVHVLVPPGQSPATYEPTARQMTALAEADLLFTIGVPMEQQLVPRIRRSFDDLTIVATQSTLEKKSVEYDLRAERARDDGASVHGHLHDDGELDPHGWLDPKQASRMAYVMYEAMAKVTPRHERQLSGNYQALDDSLSSLYSQVLGILAPVRGMEMVVFHPAYGHFAAAFHLKQVAIETTGVTPGSKYLADIIEMARDRGVKAIFVQPQFSSTTAGAVAAAIGAEIVILDPLAYDYAANLRRMAVDIVEALSPR